MRAPILLFAALLSASALQAQDPAKLAALREEARGISYKIRSIATASAKVDSGYAKACDAERDATAALQEELGKSPALTEINRRLDESFVKLTAAIAGGDAEIRKAARKDYNALQSERTEEARKVPELAVFFKRRELAEEVKDAAERTAIARTPAGKGLLERQAAIRTELSAARKKPADKEP